MYEIDKLNEANYFFNHMCNTIDEPDCFHYELSAFLSAARSVLLYALEEAQTKRNGQKWYDNYISQSDILKFFRDKRDISIHQEPVKAHKHITACINEVIHISDSINIQVQKVGSLIKKKLKKSTPQPIPKSTDMTISVKYKFPDWQGTEDVIELCRKYIKELEKFIKDGLSKRFITEELKK